MGEKDNITPALNPEDQHPNELSAEEFKRRLYSWFEDRGLLSDLRAHLRMQMINVLKDTSLGKTSTGQTKQSISPKIQAINLLIAEFLLHQDCHYSLSVFSAEMPSINVLPDLPNCVSNKFPPETTKWRFSENDLWDILETLGVTKNSEEGTDIVTKYYDASNEESLLTCIMRLMHRNLRTRDSGIDNRPSCSSLREIGRFVSNTVTVINGNAVDDLMFSDLIDILTHCGIHSTIIQQVVERVRLILISERERIAKEERETYLRLENKLNEEAARQEEEHRRRLDNLNQAIEEERRKLRQEQRDKQIQLESYSNSIHKQSLALRKHFDEILTRDQALRRKEEELQRRDKELKDREKQLQKDMTCLCSDQMELLKQKIQLEAQKPEENEDKEVPEEAASISGEAENKDSADRGQQTSAPRQGVEDALFKGMVRQLQMENSHLRTLNAEHLARIQELNQRAIALYNELETVNGRSVFRNHRSAVGTTNAPLVQPTRHRTGPASAYGGGEEGVRAQPSTPRPFRNLHNRDVRKRVSYGRLSLHSSTSDDASPTDTVLQETRERLRRLEQESDEIDRNFRRFRERQAADERFQAATNAPFKRMTLNLDNYPTLFGKDRNKKVTKTAENGASVEVASTSRGFPPKIFDSSTVKLKPFKDTTETTKQADSEEEGRRRDENRSVSEQSTGASSVRVDENMSGISNLRVDSEEAGSDDDVTSSNAGKKNQH